MYLFVIVMLFRLISALWYSSFHSQILKFIQTEMHVKCVIIWRIHPISCFPAKITPTYTLTQCIYNIELRYGHFNGIACSERITDSVFALLLILKWWCWLQCLWSCPLIIDQRTILRLFKFHTIFILVGLCLFKENSYNVCHGRVQIGDSTRSFH